MTSRFTVVRVIGDDLGAEVVGDLCAPIKPDDIAVLRALYLKHSWLLFRNQHGLTLQQQDCLAPAFGTDQKGGDHDTNLISNQVASFTDAQGNSFQNGALSYHSDGEFYEKPLSGLVLYAVDVIDNRTSTRFANGHRALMTMPPQLRAECEERDALHVLLNFVGRSRCADAPATAPRYASPLIEQHLESGKSYLSLSYQHADCIVGLAEEKSEELLNRLFDHYHDPRHVITHWWRKGDYVVWDNRMFVHARDNIENTGPRVFRRNSLGEVSLTDQYRANLARHGLTANNREAIY